MIPIQTFIQRTSAQLQSKGYRIEQQPVIDSTRGMFYAYTTKPYGMAFSKVLDHFLFVDWENDLFSRKDWLLEIYKSFNRYVNLMFNVPNWIRITIPNMAVVAIATSGFDEDVAQYASQTYMVPIKGGETGQFFLVDLSKEEIIFHRAYQYKQYGSLPLHQAQATLVPILEKSLQSGY
jgi:hypothetical protein